MADRKNQHFVPQYYFRFFSENGKHISAILKKNGQFIEGAPIKGQCAKDNFYGSKELESIFSQMETKHAQSHRAALDVAWGRRDGFFTPKEYCSLLETLVFQHGRTLLEIEKSWPAKSEMMLDMFRHYLIHSKHDDRDKFVEMIDTGGVTVTEPPQATIARIVSIAVESAPLISDLDILLLRNKTDYPFIFGDAPVVQYNTWAKDVENRGVLGMQCPGLQIFYPLDTGTYLVLYDREKYTGPFGEYMQYDLHQRSDVSSLNVLQMYHSSRAVYFAPDKCRGYVEELWNAHKNTISTPRSKYVSNANFYIDGKPPEGEIMHSFEPQIDYDLNLSFFECDPVSQEDYRFSRRSPELVEEFGHNKSDDDGT